MAAITLKNFFDLAKKQLSEKPGSAVNLNLCGQSFTATRNRDGTVSCKFHEVSKK